MDFSSKTDEELMILYQKGSEDAFSVIYERHSSKIFNFITSKVQKKEIASEIFQEVFVKIHQSKHLYKKSFQLMPWIFTITRNAIYDAFRRNSKLLNNISIDFFDLSNANPEIESGTNTSDLGSILLKLPQQQKLAIEMRYYDEKSFEEIADTLKSSPVNIRKIISRGILRIKEIIKEEGSS